MRTILKIVSGGCAEVVSLSGFNKEQVYWAEVFARYLDGAEICNDVAVVTGEYDVFHGAMRYDEFRTFMAEIGYGNEVEQADLEGCIP